MISNDIARLGNYNNKWNLVNYDGELQPNITKLKQHNTQERLHLSKTPWMKINKQKVLN